MFTLLYSPWDPIKFVGNKNFLLKILSRKPSFFKKNLTYWYDESLQCCCHSITHSRLKLLKLLSMFTLVYSLWDPYKLCWKKKNVFLLKIFYFCRCLTSNKLCWIEDQLADVATQFICWRVNHQRLDHNKATTSFLVVTVSWKHIQV